MPNSMLYDACTFTMAVPPEFDSYPKDTPIYTSGYNVGSIKKSTLHAPTLRAIMAYMNLSKASTDGISIEGLGAIGIQNGKKIIAEYIGGRKDIQCVVYNKSNGSILASVYFDENASASPFVHKGVGGKETGTAVFFALMPIFLEDKEFEDYYDILYEQFVAGFPDRNSTEEAIFKLCDNVYRRIENPTDCGTSGVKLVYPTTGNVRTITDVARKKGTYSATDIYLVSSGLSKRELNLKRQARLCQ